MDALGNSLVDKMKVCSIGDLAENRHLRPYYTFHEDGWGEVTLKVLTEGHVACLKGNQLGTEYLRPQQNPEDGLDRTMK